MPSPAVEHTFPGAPESVPLARQFVADLFEDWGMGDAAWTAQLIISELATNAALHAKSTFTINVTREPGGAVRIEVRDASQRAPRMRPENGEATTGRGLRILDELALSWGVDVVHTGKVVWALVEPPLTTLADRAPDRDELTDLPQRGRSVDEPRAGDGPRVQLQWAA